MKRARIFAVMVIALFALLVLPCVSQAGLLDDFANKLSVDATYLQSLEGNANKTAITASWLLYEKGPLGADVDVMIAPDLDHFADWGAGLSGVVKGNTVSVKLGVGYLEGTIAYLGLPLKERKLNLVGGEVDVSSSLYVSTDGPRFTLKAKF